MHYSDINSYDMSYISGILSNAADAWNQLCEAKDKLEQKFQQLTSNAGSHYESVALIELLAQLKETDKAHKECKQHLQWVLSDISQLDWFSEDWFMHRIFGQLYEKEDNWFGNQSGSDIDVGKFKALFFKRLRARFFDKQFDDWFNKLDLSDE